MAPATGKNPDIRVSDADRDAVATALAQHYQDGRLDRAEFDDRVAAAIAARTGGDLDRLLTDLPPAAPAAELARQAELGRPAELAERPSGRRRSLAFLPVVLGAVLLSVVITGVRHHGGSDGWPYAPFGFLWLIIPIAAARFWVRGWRRR
jgi:hypothetical protein